MPETEALLLGRMIRLCLPGLSDAQYARCDAEVQAYLDRQAEHFRAQPGKSASEKLILQDIHRS